MPMYSDLPLQDFRGSDVPLLVDIERKSGDLAPSDYPTPVLRSEEDPPLKDNDATASPTLLDRLWTTKMVAFDDGEEDNHSFTFATAEDDNANERAVVSDELNENFSAKDSLPVPLLQGDPSSLRPIALYCTSSEIVDLDTKTILRVLSDALPPPRPLGLEWVDDVSVCILFRNSSDATTAFFNLAHQPIGTNPLEYVPIIFAVSKRSPWFIRLALASDVKAKNAASKSAFYRKQNRTTPYDRPYLSSERPGRWRKEESRQSRPASNAEDLDRELDELEKARMSVKQSAV